jgi:signal transduction histidine kinase
LGASEVAANETVLQRVAEERLRIARELHDVIAYSFATISVQAGVAVHVLDERPEQASEALRAIKEASREALSEIRAIFGVLRRTDDTSGAQAPSLSRLDALVQTAAKAGVPTRTVILGTQRSLPAAVDLAAYRIVQESLTNVLRHAGQASALVWIEYDCDRLTIEIEDDGRGHVNAEHDASDSSGFGVIGMRERALDVGGELEAGPRPEGGFRVRAVLPAPAP